MPKNEDESLSVKVGAIRESPKMIMEDPEADAYAPPSMPAAVNLHSLQVNGSFVSASELESEASTDLLNRSEQR